MRKLNLGEHHREERKLKSKKIYKRIMLISASLAVLCFLLLIMYFFIAPFRETVQELLSPGGLRKLLAAAFVLTGLFAYLEKNERERKKKGGF